MTLKEYTSKYNNLTRVGKSAAGADSFKVDRLILTDCGYKPGMSVMDYGCGWGSFLEVVDDYGSYEGYDISPTMIEIASSKFSQNTFYLCKIGEITTTHKDVIVAHSVFTHVPKEVVNEALLDITRNLKSDGFALIDILYGEPENNMLETYTDSEWIETLMLSGLQGNCVAHRSRQRFVHHYYRCTRRLK